MCADIGTYSVGLITYTIVLGHLKMLKQLSERLFWPSRSSWLLGHAKNVSRLKRESKTEEGNRKKESIF